MRRKADAYPTSLLTEIIDLLGEIRSQLAAIQLRLNDMADLEESAEDEDAEFSNESEEDDESEEDEDEDEDDRDESIPDGRDQELPPH